MMNEYNFVKLPSGRIFNLNHIIHLRWVNEELRIISTEGGEAWVLNGEDANALYNHITGESMDI